MVSTRERVRLEGFLSGQGHEARCIVWATKVSLPGGPSAYASYEIEGGSADLPEGDYQLAVSNGAVMPVRQSGGHWLARGT
jgi:hypothetical protein